MTRARDVSRSAVPSGSTANRPASPATGQLYYDTTLGQLINWSGFSWAAAGDVASRATGGTIVTSGGFVYHTFTSSGTFAALTTLTADVLVIAGGGGASGGASYAGGGAGGLLGFSSQSISTGSYTVTIGAGGAGVNNGANAATSGNNSTFQGLTAAVGGGGAHYGARR